MELIRGICEAAKTENVNVSFFVGAQGNALSIYRVCQKRGLVPGRDIAVTGYDDVDFAQRMDPPLTTANQDGMEMGYRALKCAVSLCKGSKPVKMKLPARFMLRQSCGCKRQVEELELSDILERIVNNSWGRKFLTKRLGYGRLIQMF